MPLVTINAVGGKLESNTGGAPMAQLRGALQADSTDAPIVVMIHGFKFSPSRHDRDPHRHILSLTPETSDRKAVSWPRHLGFGGPDAGLNIAYGWQADGNIWRAYDTAHLAGRALAQLCRMLRDLCPHRPLHLFAHSLGARVALAALSELPAHSINRAVLMAPAELAQQARNALHSPAGQTAEILAITSRENDLFDFLFEGLLGLWRGPDRILTHATKGAPHNLATLQIDHPETLGALGDLGFRVAPSRLRICHWSPYLRPGMFPLYRAFLNGGVPFSALKSCQKTGQTPRWSRLLPIIGRASLLPFARKFPS